MDAVIAQDDLEESIRQLTELRASIEAGRHPLYKCLTFEEKQAVWMMVNGSSVGPTLKTNGEIPMSSGPSETTTTTASARQFVMDTDGKRYPLPTLLELRSLYKDIYSEMSRGTPQSGQSPAHSVEPEHAARASLPYTPTLAQQPMVPSVPRPFQSRPTEDGLPYDYEDLPHARMNGYGPPTAYSPAGFYMPQYGDMMVPSYPYSLHPQVVDSRRPRPR